MDAHRLSRVPFGDAWIAAGEPTADVMDVRSRLAMYRSLVERTTPVRPELNPFWGYASQLAWQHRSGRLGEAGEAIAPGSWWGACNFALSVVPYAAAMDLGLVPRLPIAASAYAGVRPRWHEALRALRDAEDLDRVRVAIWSAHLASITLAVRMHAAEHRVLPPAEQRFARGWVRMVDLFAAAALRTDLDKLIETGGGALPSRVLHGADVADLPRHERSTVRRVGALADRPAWRWALELRAWRRIMRTRAARGDAERLLAGLLGAGQEVWPARLRALAYATFPAPVIERRSSR
ncbi:MAG TPA: Leg1-related protein [Kofleriaceae bacterium]|nr:Leg1-related protein [Kofleriaceae bacterium]